MSARGLTLNDVAERLGVHYMTVYRYVRTGRLEARQQGSQWLVREEEFERFKNSSATSRIGRRASSVESRRSSVERLSARLIAGDEAGSWGIAEEAQVSGATAKEIYLELFAPAMRTIGEKWAEGAITVADEHRASVVMYRLVGRMGPQFRPRGPRIGTIIVAAPAGERHGLPVTLGADLLRLEGFDVVDLGADVPADALVACALDTNDLMAVSICVTLTEHLDSARDSVHALRDAAVDVPIVLSGAAVSGLDAETLGADQCSTEIEALVGVLRGERVVGD